ncbi:hypothetical protein O7599_04080 [Streptomyces sp. WMMC500]|uniref:hypothetical protein n=1 Tax=Streptomyces sp. WMMC500 TaxID=3015154 RepID=UPI00248ACF22|nr:hypothetical protein [Streptomyces sp. WMMC500]WBB61740.1 hypothetical protein O7599_04080 [Streptomyces sp. WMMC500]
MNEQVGRAVAAVRGALPPPRFFGFLLVLAVVFAVAYGVGSAVGPVAPDMHGSDPESGVSDAPAGDSHGTHGG